MRRSKTRSKILAVVMLALSVLSMASLGGITLLAGCAAEKVRDTVGVKTSMAMDDAIVEDAYVGVDTLPETERPNAAAKVKAFSDAIASGDRLAIASDAWSRWPDVRVYAEAGIESQRKAGTIGTGVAASKLERISQFGRLLARTVGVPP